MASSEALAESVPAISSAEMSKKSAALDILDPANFTLDSTKSRNRFTKDSFTKKNSTQIGTLVDPSDPLSQLDPLWTLAKKDHE